MKWEIRAHYNAKFIEDWLKIRIEKQVRLHLSYRGYNVWSDKIEKESIDGINYSLKFEFIESIISVQIESKKWKGKPNQVVYPPLVFLIEDYFKIESKLWFYLETLNENETESIKKLNRILEPSEIVLRLKEMNFDQKPLKPKLELLSRHNSFNIDFYSGLKTGFDHLTNFWFSFLSWVSYSDFEYTNLNYLLTKGYFHPDYGSCIPLVKDEIRNEINYTQAQIEWFNENEIQRIYLMRKNFDNRVILFAFAEKYLVYHCWTNE